MGLNIFKKFTEGLAKTKNDLSNKLNHLVALHKKVDEELFEDLEDVLIGSDIGVSSTMAIMEQLRLSTSQDKLKEPQQIVDKLKEIIKNNITQTTAFDEGQIKTPLVLLIVGVNGVGKTTTIGKLANRYKQMGHDVLVAAGDTFRAAATEQLQIWCERAGVDLISSQEGSDPAAVIFDAIQSAKARKKDVLICDTAGRLHNKKNLMNELNKIFRVVKREYEEAEKQVYLVIDATTGQNGITQAKMFKEVANIDGIVLTKLDGTSKGGIIIPVQDELGIPVRYVGLGEKLDDLQVFDPNEFVSAIFDQ
jgi:fused signal recognition particle receptor